MSSAEPTPESEAVTNDDRPEGVNWFTVTNTALKNIGGALEVVTVQGEVHCFPSFTGKLIGSWSCHRMTLNKPADGLQ